MSYCAEKLKMGVNFDFEVKFDLGGQGQSPPKQNLLTEVFYTYGPNLAILAWTGDELSRIQTWWRTDGGTNNTRRPKVASILLNKMLLKLSSAHSS